MKSELEKQINYAIVHGPRLTENGLGTILPTVESLKLGDQFAARQERENGQYRRVNLSGCNIRQVQGERRYYLTESIYAVVRNRQARWFEIRADGDYSIPAPGKAEGRA